MHTPQLFNDLLVILLVSVPVAFLSIRLKLPLLVGLMLTGIVIGPYGLALISDLKSIEILAEIGVMLLLFTIGLEFSVRRLKEMKTLVLIGGGMQVILTTAVTAAAFTLLGRTVNQSIFFGFLVALSSTAIVLKSYVDRREVDSPHGRAGVGILLFQDISVVLMMLFVPILAGTGFVSAPSLILNLSTSLTELALIVLAAWFLVPKFLKFVVRLRSPEVFLLTVVLLCLGMSWITQHFGMSLALGAFIAGMVMADSEYSHQATTEILPFRDVFNSIFFVSIGLLLSLTSLIQNLPTVLIFVTALIVGKALIVLAVIRALGFPYRIAVMTALGLAQIGEFSFVLGKIGRGSELLSDADYQIFLAASVISMIATPFLIAAAPKIGYFVQSLISDTGQDEAEDQDIHQTVTADDMKDHVIIVGYGLNGRNLARVLRSVGVAHVIIDLNSEVIRKAREKGEKIMFGDATRREVLKHAGIRKAAALVLAMSDARAARRTVQQAHQMNKRAHIIVRTRYTSEITELLELGANEVIPEEFETSIEIFSRVLQHYGIARPIIEEEIEKIRSQGYEMLRSPSVPKQVEIANLNAALQDAVTETVKLTDESPAVGKTLGELDLRNASGATVIAVVRGGKTKINPGANYRLEIGDSVVVLCSANKIGRAIDALQPAEMAGFNA